ncbi:hypothetical protein Hdeb2414_s0001g00012121 [Helianthus debilis subsp. tardiflorus]
MMWFQNFSFHTPSLPPNSTPPNFPLPQNPQNSPHPLNKFNPTNSPSSVQILSEPWFRSPPYLHHNHYQYQIPQNPNQFWLPSNPNDVSFRRCDARRSE